MCISVYRISFSSEIPYLDEIYNYLTEIEKKKMSSFNIISSFYFIKKNRYIGYLLISKKEMMEYEIILKNNFIPYLCEDLGSLILNNDLNLERDLEFFVNLDNCNEYDNFIYEVNQWIFSNLELDSILDRINLYGIKTLRPIDKEFLKTI